MTTVRHGLLLTCFLIAAGCGGGAPDTQDNSGTAAAPAADTGGASMSDAEWEQIVPGLQARTLVDGSGSTAAPGQVAVVHYTGWLHDPAAADGRGSKFDSSVDRDQTFEFPLGAGRVIAGWDQGVAGMQVGEKRELLIAPEMAYGDRQVGNLIPPGSTLLFEVELIDVRDAP